MRTGACRPPKGGCRWRTLERWLPGILPYGDQVTIRQLLGHTSGVPTSGRPSNERCTGPGRADSTPRPHRSWSLWWPGDPRLPAGHRLVVLQHTGYILLGLVVQTAGGATLAQELQRRIVEPLGLRRTYLPGDARELPEPRSRLHRDPAVQQVNPLDPQPGQLPPA